MPVVGLAQPTVDDCDNLTHAGNRHRGRKDRRPLYGPWLKRRPSPGAVIDMTSSAVATVETRRDLKPKSAPG
jgi:hypothetical protein